ncbi:hypothetical protein GWI33_016539 [Rhynchophorus ferrugineus]|uniref:Secreted protein n=1 Tax=Rhynchophorus ferrugineus TaxID=354439 RepID=A0A834I1I6_RHYFE|nr:hypothetical protein GWI33_016539 [Rhynchophorus ferrugineus]
MSKLLFVLYLLAMSMFLRESSATNCTCLENSTIPEPPENKTESESTVCSSQQPSGKEFCPRKDQAEEKQKNCIPFPEDPTTPPDNEVIYSTRNEPTPKTVCRKCGLRLTNDGDAVVVQCSECYQIPDDKKSKK